ncbi:uncharacterized protein LOC129615255 [Condylostylus longicornis]|uniref:uncharacterized protein LOC129615255 n=1 Tax=Condylostylus longicornis TaxID=2530218 RepID=UPI00244E5B8C|nr:uncharacterized protein LOC129615255 [Condylostylus longicornis]
MEMKKFVLILFIAISSVSAAPAKEVTNQEIRDTILSLVHSYHLLDNKLERHEHRERALGEMVKKALQSLQKGQKAFEPMNGIFSRLDERVSQIETMLMAQEEKYNTQSDKVGDALEGIFKWMKENNECNNKKLTTLTAAIAAATPPPPPPPIQLPNQDELIKKIDLLSQNVKDLMKTSKDYLQQSEKLLTSKLATADEVISKMEDKLSNFYITVPSTPSPAELNRNKEFEIKMETYLENISSSLKEPFDDLRKINEKMIDIDRSINERANETINSIEDLKVDILTTSDKAFTKIASRINESAENINESIENIALNFNETVTTFYTDLNGSYSNLANGLKIFNDFDKILLSTSDHILDTQKKIEFSTYQIVQKIGEIVKSHNSDFNITINKRFDNIDKTIMTNRMDLLKNLSKTMENEISHVWRQIQIMYSEITDSKDVLKKIQGQTESYINGTISTMDGVEGNVGQITSRMAEVDSNLNFLLGRLSLVTQEFNRIKIGLGTALDDIRNSFQAVQDKIKEVGPGPHKIPEYEYENNIAPFHREPNNSK